MNWLAVTLYTVISFVVIFGIVIVFRTDLATTIGFYLLGNVAVIFGSLYEPRSFN